MQRWRAPELMALYDAARAAGLYTFVVRRTVQRLERGEIMPTDAVRIILGNFRGVACSTPRKELRPD